MKKNDLEKDLVFGIGWNRTGTRTLTNILKNAGYSAAHWSQTKHLCESWVKRDFKLFYDFIKNNKYDAFSDAPWCFPDLYKHLYSEFPEAKFILTIRDTEGWIQSYKNLYEKNIKDIESIKVLPFINNKKEYGWIHPILFEGCTKVSGNESIYRKIYENYNDEVKSFFQSKQKNLFIVDWSKEDSTDRISKFLERKINILDVPWIKDQNKK